MSVTIRASRSPFSTPRLRAGLLAMAALVLSAGCASGRYGRYPDPYHEHGYESEHEYEYEAADPHWGAKRPGGHGGYPKLHIPPGHLPPPGSCRIWYPGVPPGQQPPPGPCGYLEHHVPRGAWLLYRPHEHPREVQVHTFDPRRPSVRIDIRIYDTDTGVFLRAVAP